jgi:hypothetical protein
MSSRTRQLTAHKLEGLGMVDLVLFVAEKTVADYIRRLTPLIESHSQSALAIARELADAEASLSKKDYRVVLAHFRLSYSTACKRVKVGRSDRIKQYESKLACIDAWSTLHELTKLAPDQFEQFAAQYLSGDKPRNFMRADVERFKSGTCAKREPFSLLASIEVDLSRLQQDEDIDAIAEEVEQFARTLGARFPATRVRHTDLVARLDAKNEAEATKAMKDEVSRAVKAARKRLREVVAEEKAKGKVLFEKRWALSDEEIFSRSVNPNDMLDHFGHERVEPNLVDSEFDAYWHHEESGTCAISPAERADILAELREEDERRDHSKCDGGPSGRRQRP